MEVPRVQQATPAPARFRRHDLDLWDVFKAGLFELPARQVGFKTTIPEIQRTETRTTLLEPPVWLLPRWLRTETERPMNAPLIIDIPNSVPRILSPNSRSHWGTKAQVQARVKADAMWATIDAAGNTPEGALMCLKDAPLPLTLHFAVGWESRRRKRMDDDNIKASLKWHIDGIASALGIDDRHMIVGTVTQTYDEAKRGFVRVAVEPAREARS